VTSHGSMISINHEPLFGDFHCPWSIRDMLCSVNLSTDELGGGEDAVLAALFNTPRIQVSCHRLQSPPPLDPKLVESLKQCHTLPFNVHHMSELIERTLSQLEHPLPIPVHGLKW
jgi:hypothetical protein